MRNKQKTLNITVKLSKERGEFLQQLRERLETESGRVVSNQEVFEHLIDLLMQSSTKMPHEE